MSRSCSWTLRANSTLAICIVFVPMFFLPGVSGFLFLLSPVLFLIGLALGIAGIVQRRRKKLFAGLGTALNGLPLILIVGLFVLGAALGPAA